MSKDTIYLDEKAKALTQEVVGGGGVFTVHLTRGENEWLEQDKTNDEILQAVYTNGVVCCIYELSDGGVNNALILKAYYDERKEMYYFELLVGDRFVEHPYFNETHFYVSDGDE